MFVHESTHALDHLHGKDLNKTHNSEYGNNIRETDTRAISEENKYRASVGEGKRLAYNSHKYNENNPGKIKNPEEFEKVESIRNRNEAMELAQKYAERQKRIDAAKNNNKSNEDK